MGEGGEGGSGCRPPTILVIYGPITTKFYTGNDNQSVSSNTEKIQKINDVIDNDFIIQRNLSKKTVKRVYFKIAPASLFFCSTLLKLYRNINQFMPFLIEMVRFKILNVSLYLMMSST